MPQGKETVTDEEILNNMSEDEDPFHSSAEVGKMFDHTRQWAHSRLSDLYEEGRIQQKKAGKRSVIWWPED